MHIYITENTINNLRPQLTVDYKHIFNKLSQFLLDVSIGDWKDAAKQIMASADTVRFDREPEKAVWILIRQSLVEAITELAFDQQNHVNLDLVDANEIIDRLTSELGNNTLVIDEAFFSNPRASWIVSSGRNILLEWLTQADVQENNAKGVSNRFPAYFTVCLYENWGKNFHEYAFLEPLLRETQFAKAVNNAQSWLRYMASLEKIACQPVFGSTVSLCDIYIRLRGYYDVEQSSDRSLEYNRSSVQAFGKSALKRHVFFVDEELQRWIGSDDKTDCVKVICGGPGYGKTSLVKIFSSKLAESGVIPIIYIPLHDFQTCQDFEDSLSEFLSNDNSFNRRINPLQDLRESDESNRLLVILDGLDEISMKELDGEEATQKFVRNVFQKIASLNFQTRKLLVLFTGRDFSVKRNQEWFSKSNSIINLLPYCIPKHERSLYSGEHGTLALDQRDEWWRRYGKVTGYDYQNMPEYLNTNELNEITTQPLLNYLLAIAFGDPHFSIDRRTNINSLYRRILDTVYNADWRSTVPPTIGSHISIIDFVMALEVIAIVAWHGDGLGASIKDIIKLLKESSLEHLSRQIEIGSNSGVIRLLTAFYFRATGNNRFSIDRYEFTHKSFAEYLVARQLIELSNVIKVRLHEERHYLYGFTLEVALVRWVGLCGPKPMTIDLYNFLFRELQLLEPRGVVELHQCFTTLFNHLLENGMPMHRTTDVLDFPEQVRQARNAEESLFALLHATAVVSGQVSKIHWPSSTAFGDFVMRLRGQRGIGQKAALVTQFTGSLDLRGQVLIAADLYSANLKGSDLSSARLENADLGEADLRDTKLRKANLGDANLGGAILQNADLEEARLFEAKLRGADLSNAILVNADLSNADLRNATLTGCKLANANLSDARLKGANLHSVQFDERSLVPRKNDNAIAG